MAISSKSTVWVNNDCLDTFEDWRMSNIRTLSEILIDADRAKTPFRIHQLRNELNSNHTHYTNIQLDFAEEHFTELYNNLITINV